MYRFICIISTLMLIVCFSACGNGDPMLVKINSRCISVKDFYRTVPAHDFSFYSVDQQKEKVTNFANDELMLYDAHKKRLHRESSYTKQIDYYYKNSLIDEYLMTTIVDSIVSENYLLHAYAGLGQRFRDAHPYSKYREHLFQSAVSEKRDELQNALFALMKKIASDYSFAFDDSALNFLSKAYNDTFLNRYGNNSPDITPDRILMSIKDDRTVLKTKSRSYSKSWLENEIDLRRLELPYGTIDPKLFKNIFETIAIEDIFYRLSLKNNLDKSSRFYDKYENYKRSFLLSQYKLKMINSAINVNDDSLLAFYSKHKNSRYLLPSRAEVCEIFIKDSLRASQILKIALKSRDFCNLAKKHTERFRNQDRPGYLGFITADQYGGIGKAAQNIRTGEVGGSLIRSGEGFSIIKTLSFIPPEPKSFETVKATVAQDYSEQRYKVVCDSLINTLGNKYRFKIFFENINVK